MVQMFKLHRGPCCVQYGKQILWLYNFNLFTDAVGGMGDKYEVSELDGVGISDR